MITQEINQIYDQFEKKDMPRHEFVKKVQELTSQTGVQRDLDKIMSTKQAEAIQKQRIDRAVQNAR